MSRSRKRKKPTPDKWEPRAHQDRPTPQRRAHGEWVLDETDRAGIRAARDVLAHPIDRLEHAGVLNNDQASAGRDFEELWRSQNEIHAIRDSCLTWQPKGHASDDGPVGPARAYRALCRDLGMIRERQLRWVCVQHNEPKPSEIGPLREALNECVRFFK